MRAGDVIAEIETDKATMEVEAVDEGTLGRIIVQAGSSHVAVNALIALILEEGEDPASLDNLNSPLPSPKPDKPSSAAPLKAPESLPDEKASSCPSPLPAGEKRIFASPLARRLAAERNVDLQTLAGSGPNGRIIKADIENGVSNTPSKGFVDNNMAYVDRPINSMRKVIAERLTQSKQQVPHFYLTVDCHLDALMNLRKDINACLEEDRLSVNDFIIRAAALALIKVPDANVSWQGTALRHYQSADIAVAVAIDNGLITPIVRAAHMKPLREISKEMKQLAEKARAGKLQPDEFQGGTFTVSNLGMYGIKSFGAIINPPQACILAVGIGEQRPVVRDGQVQIATQMTCTLSVDHRAVDGAVGSAFFKAFKDYMEDPLKLLV